jgi:hypothetical protein
MARASVIGGETVARNMRAVQRRFLEGVNRDMRKVASLLDSKVMSRISLGDHSLDDLAALGHPYARRAPQAIHDPQYAVHTQSGELLASKFSGTEDATVTGGGKLTAEAYVGVSESVDHALFVILGTSKMIPRDFLTGSLEECREQAFDLLRASMKNTIVSFNGEKVKL